MPTPDHRFLEGETVCDSLNIGLIEASDADGTMTVEKQIPPLSAEALLQLMRERIRFYGSPLPEGFVAPPGIDIKALLKQVPWPQPRPDDPQQ